MRTLIQATPKRIRHQLHLHFNVQVVYKSVPQTNTEKRMGGSPDYCSI